MRRKTRSGRRWAVVALALTLALVAAAPATAKGPVLNPYACSWPAPASPRSDVLCARTPTGHGQGLTGGGIGIVAGGAALLVLAMAAAVVATYRREAHGPRPAALG